MADPQDGKPGVIDSANRVLVLAFDLADTELHSAPQQLLAAIQSKQVEDEIKRTLLGYVQSQRQAGHTSSVASGDEAKRFFTNLADRSMSAAGANFQERIKQTPEFKKLTLSLTGFQKSVVSSPFGMWIDENKKILYIVGAGLVVGGATALYVTRTGGSLASSAAARLAGGDHDVLQIGKFKLTAGGVSFDPSARILGTRIGFTGEWKKVNFDLKLGILAQDLSVQQVHGEATVKSGPITVMASADSATATKPVHLLVNINYKRGQIDLGLGALYQDQRSQLQVAGSWNISPNASLSLNGGVMAGGPASGAAAGQQSAGLQYNAMGNFKLSF